MRRSITLVLISFLLLWSYPRLAGAQDTDPPARKVVSKVNPVYPEIARKLQLSGTVKMDVIIAANGTVKKAKVLGGSPLLAEAAERALQKMEMGCGSRGDHRGD
jgi:TonB family protein